MGTISTESQRSRSIIGLTLIMDNFQSWFENCIIMVLNVQFYLTVIISIDVWELVSSVLK